MCRRSAHAAGARMGRGPGRAGSGVGHGHAYCCAGACVRGLETAALLSAVWFKGRAIEAPLPRQSAPRPHNTERYWTAVEAVRSSVGPFLEMYAGVVYIYTPAMAVPSLRVRADHRPARHAGTCCRRATGATLTRDGPSSSQPKKNQNHGLSPILSRHPGVQRLHQPAAGHRVRRAASPPYVPCHRTAGPDRQRAAAKRRRRDGQRGEHGAGDQGGVRTGAMRN